MANLLTNADFTETLPNGRIVGWAGKDLTAAGGVLTSSASGGFGDSSIITAPVTWLYADYTGPAPYPEPDDWNHHAADRLVPEPGEEYVFKCQMGADGGDVRAILCLGTMNMEPDPYDSSTLVPTFSEGAVQLHEVTYTAAPSELVTEVAVQATVPTDYVYAADGADSNGLTVIFLGQAGVTRIAITGAVLNVAAEEPVPEPEPEVPTLARRVAAFLGKPDNPLTLGRATVHCDIVTEYVRGYTRGRGFDTEDAPAKPLESVIVAATARLTANPEQVSYYATGDYSERPAVLAGWTLPELAVLNRYRKRTA